MIILKYFSRCVLIAKPIFPVSNLPPCSAKGIGPLGATTQGMSYPMKESTSVEDPEDPRRRRGPPCSSPPPLFRHSQETNDYSVQQGKRVLSFLKSTAGHTALNTSSREGLTGCFMHQRRRREVHDTYANSWWKVFTVAKPECVHPSVCAWLKQVHCSLIRRAGFRKGLTNGGHSKFFIVYQLWMCSGGCVAEGHSHLTASAGRNRLWWDKRVQLWQEIIFSREGKVGMGKQW